MSGGKGGREQGKWWVKRGVSNQGGEDECEGGSECEGGGRSEDDCLLPAVAGSWRTGEAGSMYTATGQAATGMYWLVE